MSTSEQRRPELSAQAIAACAVTLADREGLESVSMRRVAETLGVSAMALYRHVENREALLLAMAGQTARRSALIPLPPASWQEMLRRLAVSLWEGFVQHPWLLQIVLGPSRLLDMAPTAELEHLLSALQDAGLSSEECFDCVVGISAVVIGTSTLALAANPGPGVNRPSRPNAVVRLEGDVGSAGDKGEADAGLAAAFRRRGITFDASRRSLNFAVDSFLRGIQARIEQPRAAQQPPSAH
ncbi:TetR/AcrR family transcriptional regulator C-terminal domain-containing protein [Arthrobacter sp. APC 3897]|uniref:TetR/AcrR family transcriptional regulator n=1 Tax=Arthrobacter sp. APC 3897 TaxID=3035204 RepID=UPI0025B51194|nr:TetR/AcrR family transcriptional regulator C-terminal domain-containing protein [Arthrobacter sp. APC 3897]MDN3480350.1 TetR/AcrR family transcriptional regulator C-terminal domain-containing protein [Arthrobacter sp. APC 3897]